MRLVSFKADDGMRIGFVKDDKVIDLTSVDKTAPRDIQAVIADGELSTLQAIADRVGDDALLNFDEII